MAKKLNVFQNIGDIAFQQNFTTEVQKFIDGQEISVADFEERSLEHNAKYSANDTSNPLVYGLQLLDNMAMAISGKTVTGVTQFDEHLMYSTAYHMKQTNMADATNIVLLNLEMFDPVYSGVKAGFPQAINFYELSAKIAKDIQRGVRVNTYQTDVLNYGWETMKEWHYRE